MNESTVSVMLRVHGDEFDAHAFVSTQRSLNESDAWKKGDPTWGKRTAEKSGFAVCVAEEADLQKALETAAAFCEENSEMFKALQLESVESYLSCECPFEVGRVTSRMYVLESTVIKRLAAFDLSVEFAVDACGSDLE